MVDDRSEQPDRLSPAGYSKLDYGRSWSSQEWKSEVTASDRSEKPDKTSWNAVQQIWSSSWRRSSRRKCTFSKVRRDDS